MVAIPKISALFETSLASALSAAGTSFTVVSGTDRDGNALSGLYGFIIDEGSADEEFFVGTISGTTVTISARGLDADDPVTEVTANKKAHRRGASVKITDYPILAYLRNVLAGESGYTLPALLRQASSVGNPINADDLARKAYVDSVVAGIATTVNVIVPGTAGETLAAGNLIYFDDADNEWKKCDADTTATVENTLLGIAQGAGVDGEAISSGVLLRGLDANQSGLTAGAVYYASNTAGSISATVGTKEVTVGFSYSTTQLYFNPRFNQQLTEDEQDALAGSSGTPSSSNKFVTEADVSAAAASGKIVRATGSALPALSGENLTNLPAITKISNVYTDVTVGNTTTETNLISVTIPGGSLSTANALRARLYINNLTNNDGTKGFTIRLKLGATTIATISGSATAISVACKGYIDVMLLATGATNSQEGSIGLNIGTDQIISAGSPTLVKYHSVGTAAEDSTTNKTLAVSIQWADVGATNTVTMSHAIIEKIA